MPCNPSPCGANAVCKERNGAGSCSCLPEYFGDPYSGCRPECVTNSDCDRSKACMNNKCKDPCPGTCGINAECRVINHAPSCSCLQGYSGDPLTKCLIIQASTQGPTNPCVPSPCGPNSLCKEIKGHAVCTCQPNFVGSPPSCRPECVVSSDCSQDKACINQRCADPCPGTCGQNARCQVVNHNPICSCPSGFTGDPFLRCSRLQPSTTPSPPSDPCAPSPCGPYSQCRTVGSTPACSCLPNYIGNPPNCRPECIINAECAGNLACQNEKCIDPCPGSCGHQAECRVVNHNPVCTCPQGYIGDASTSCHPAPIATTERSPEKLDPCHPTPCGANAECHNRNGVGACSCLAGFQGDPYAGCRRECESNQDCAPPLACIGYKCSDPCPGTCGTGAECIVANHIPICTCPAGFTGDPFFSCHQAPSTPSPIPRDPCLPSPCGPNSQCRTVNQQAVCSCLPSYVGHPPTCRPECIVSSECPLDKACINQKCADPCPNTCGLHAQCNTKNHNPICACPQGYTGDPFSQCHLIPAAPPPPPTPEPVTCTPSPCGPNAQCQIVGGQLACSCLPNFLGAPPNCRPECVLSSECSSQLACINQKCRDPCPGSCGANTKCSIINHVPVCSCENGFTGDPFTLCSAIPITTPSPVVEDPCNPSPCGPNAVCRPGGICECIPEYNGNPYEACRPECVLSTECPRDKACQRNKCRNPCPGTCGTNAQCDVINHIPTCSCPQSFTGDPFTHCRPIPADSLKPKDLCNPSPCGPNSQCRAPNGVAVCSCLAGYVGSPPSCKPECILSNECSQTQACVNNKCTDPCAGSCGLNARCQVINHSPICSCPPGNTGDPFRSCYPLPIPAPSDEETPKNPCAPSPCGPNSQCQASGKEASCSCLPNYVGAPPNCRPECVINPDCSTNQACINNKCTDPCIGTCGLNAQCAVISHAVTCTCLQGYTGNAFIQCLEQKHEVVNPCEPSPCGPNAVCTQKNNAGSCACIADYTGNPYEGCRPECVLSSDCPTDKACIRNKCQDPCPGVCGSNAQCNVVNHVPTCSCIQGYVGDPFTTCSLLPPPAVTEAAPVDPCKPSPCGPNSQCRTVNGQAVCSCAPEFSGSPPNCRPECVVNSECPTNRACYKHKCTDPCPGTCGINARCQVINHSPICSCLTGQTGDPFTRCYPMPVTPEPVKPTNPCLPNPCGQNSHCQVAEGNQASCSCQANYIGSPPNCRPECLVNTDCPTTQACITEKCRDPCQGSCGLNAECRVQNHIPNCYCAQGFSGDPFTQCSQIIEKPKPVEESDPCTLCGVNTNCNNGVCICLPSYFGDPLKGCRPECTMNSDCSREKACVNQHCIDPCPGTCGQGAVCNVINHIPTCSCPPPTSGDPFVLCKNKPVETPRDPCSPSPCGPNSICRVSDGHAVCSCAPGQVGTPPQCRPECVVSAECPLTQACLNNKCRDPCPGICGLGARCNVVNHNPICSCPSGQTGDPFRQCFPIPATPKPVEPVNPCEPSPCGPNSQCHVRGDNPACSCMTNYIGVPPNCRPECTINPECGSNRACVNQKCIDPCPGSCGANAVCSVVNHTPICSCSQGHTGDPFTSCSPIPAEPTKPPTPLNPCDPSPCGSNAQCRIENRSYAVCECLPEYQGNPYEGCRPECVVSSDCPTNKACLKNKCLDPCPGTCGLSAVCTVSNHIPICSCPPGYTGDAFTRCEQIPQKEPKDDPCWYSPCGPNARCTNSNGIALCECLPGFSGTPTDGCKPECTISSDCPRNRACVSNKCIDPCPGVCGFQARCQVLNHSPICSCPPNYVGDPFSECREAPAPPKDPCNPSPCGVNGQCRVQNGIATCVYPECVINQDCPRDKACYAQKCQDPCIDACGINAICQAVNHKAVCSCPPDYTGEPRLSCQLFQPAPPPPECTTDHQCRNDKACINQMCKDPCQAATTSVCAYNAVCSVIMHRPICVCRDGLSGNAHTQCYDIGCRTDSECPVTESCVNKQCMDPCRLAKCGIGAYCEPEGGKGRCICPPGSLGNPFISCETPQCTQDVDCPSQLACRNLKCVDPCDCAPGAICTVAGHQPTCRCPPGYSGNPHQSCTIAPIVDTTKCQMDADCASKLACFSGECKNPCTETNPCGTNAECRVVDTLPLRTMSCHCLPGYIGDADVQCKLEESTKPQCSSDSQCSDTESCINRECVNPCLVSSPCGNNAECRPDNHKVTCHCPEGLAGNPYTNCYKPLDTSPECKSDSECASQLACINQRCQNPCVTSNPCSSTAECTTLQHRPTCTCPQGWAGDPQSHCYKPECRIDSDCLYDKACISGNCLSPCRESSCGRGAECRAVSHSAQCVCPLGTQGDPHVSCVTVVCQYNEDCADHEACDRLNRVCRPVCESDVCGTRATCIARSHQHKCICEPGTQGDPYVECTVDYRAHAECIQDSDCPSKTGCINRKCQDPCSLPAVCAFDQECRVQDTLPMRTVLCVCPPDTIASIDGHCRPIIKTTEECQADSECRDLERCVRGSCVEACRIDPCGLNALCQSTRHQSVCTCPRGYIGNPHIECNPDHAVSVPSYQPVPECSHNDDCPANKRCKNQLCVNPCTHDSPCAPGAFCHTDDHQPVCRCPAGFQGNPLTQCIPPAESTVGCSSNSDCTPREACVNKLCISPCNCGTNAECKVTNHYPTCYCKPGYSGNPQIGCIKVGCESESQCSDDKTCYNSECINPCILGDPCGINAECYGAKHAAQCKCNVGYRGNPLVRCERIECSVDSDCSEDRLCRDHHCINPCQDQINPTCAHNAICYVRNHQASCRCPDWMPLGDPLSYCQRVPPVSVPTVECEKDVECPSQLACINNKCLNPCVELSPCTPSSMCSVFDSTPVRTMVCTCPEGWVPDNDGECKPVIVPSPPGCVSDNECSSNETCINRMCRNPCNCGPNAECMIMNHRPICSCIPGYDGNPDVGCRAVGCRIDSECGSGKACINGNCINPCVVEDPCGPNAECYPVGTRPECRCLSGYRGNPYDRCLVVGCRSNSDCPNDRACINAQCINPCIYDQPCAARAKCFVQNHLPLCRCPPAYEGNPYTSCRLKVEPECRVDGDCPSFYACFNQQCKDPCQEMEPCQKPALCEAIKTLPVRTMICECPPGYISSGSGVCKATPPVVAIGECISDSDCPSDRACINAICKNPCNCGPNADCRVRDHKPVCSCLPGYDGNAEIECQKAGCRSNTDCPSQQACLNRECVPACSPDGSSCGTGAICYGSHHTALCECPPGLTGDPHVGCVHVECETNSDCPSDKACINSHCKSPCEDSDPCLPPGECTVFNHVVDCKCPPGFIGDTRKGCTPVEVKCKEDQDCPKQTACINQECVNPCNATQPCGTNSECKVFDTYPVRTMICECLPGYYGNAAVECVPVSECSADKGFVRNEDGECVCPPGTGLNLNDECERCPPEKGLKVDEKGRCVCDLEKGLIVDERGNCICRTDLGYHLDINGNCLPVGPGCTTDDDCLDSQYCNSKTKICEDPCAEKVCGINAFCNTTSHTPVCQCIKGNIGDPEVICKPPVTAKTDFPQPEMIVSCLSDGVQVEIHIEEKGFNGVLYVKGHSKDEKCRRVLSVPNDSPVRTEIFKVNFGTCGLIHVNGQASFVLVIQKHPMLVTFKTQAYHIKCVYTTGEQNVTLGFNVSMLTTAGTIANTGPPPTCFMRIVTHSGQEINSAEIGDNLMLQVEVQPSTIYGGFARSCVAKTMEDTVENEYEVTDENGCATDPSIFGEWDYNPETQSLMANFNAFKFPSSDNIRFQCNIRVCFGKCQPVNCRGYNAFGRRRREIRDTNRTGADIYEPVSEGQLREEITIQSNAILTFERREERFIDPREGRLSPEVQQIDDICVSMIGFIIALVITALLALVAVAVAVSCWLIAYRRRPKVDGPLPHPPDFPNPLFTTPDPLAEPSPDYLS
ncbi:unnamed protein product [Nezara viridula]|uniref:EGF-like domain-containing protein n=1 Tax=Nezara viridula TaxID=85310 RepID=A0A9P0HNS0_NEZVI|nr:unnamed protein product [Nezara viridula]